MEGFAPGTKEIKNAWDNRRGFDRSLVAGIFCVSCNLRCHSPRFGSGPDITCDAFGERQIGERIVRRNKSDSFLNTFAMDAVPRQ